MLNLREVGDATEYQTQSGDWQRLPWLAADEIRGLRAVIQEMHQHYNPGSGPFDTDAALAALPKE